MAKVVTEENFQELMQSALPVMIDFSATWCGPCRALAPVVEELASEYEGRAIVAKADVDECPNLAGELHIRAVPTIIFFKESKPIDKSTGNVPKSQLVDKLNALL